ncbi:MAG: hypothetical protein JSW53_05280 [Candidatus Bathyarchaeota archaeon]|nr:MAG: hypothetical protein JSW53_05280 [Candidatus Bathyarchaeota archaeon]
MRKLRVLMLDKFVDNVLRAIQATGCIHVVDIRKALVRWENLLEPCTASEEIARWRSISKRIERILEELGLQKDLGLLEQIFKRRERSLIEIDPTEEIELIKNAENVVVNVEKEIEERIKRFRLLRELLWELRTAKMGVEDFRSSDRVSIKLGKLASEKILPLENELKSRVGYSSLYVRGKKRIRFVAVISPRAFSEEIEKTTGEHGLVEISIPESLSGTPSSCLRFLDSELNNILKENERRILCLRDAVLAKIDRLIVKEKLGQTERIFVLEGWIPREKEEDLKTLIDQAAEGHATVSISDPDEAESEIPTLLRKRRLLGHFRMLTEMYGMPQYNEIDPTPFLAVFFAFFVGLMNADLAIGTTIIISSLLIRRGAGSRSENMKSLSTILLCIGISSIFFGVLMGEFMGRLIALPILWISAADSPIDFLLIVIGIGMVHLIFGTVLGFLNSFLKREFRKIIGKHLSTLLLIGSGAFFLLTGRFEFEGVAIAGYLAGIAGLATLIIGNGLLGLLELTRLLSNVISYVRILALNMATTVMSRTFVLLGGLLISVAFVGPILNGVLLLFSHFFIVFISVFATFAHSLRLHYVEFFGRFFIGGGTKFSPLTSERVYTTSKFQSERQNEGDVEQKYDES